MTKVWARWILKYRAETVYEVRKGLETCRIEIEAGCVKRFGLTHGGPITIEEATRAVDELHESEWSRFLEWAKVNDVDPLEHAAPPVPVAYGVPS